MSRPQQQANWLIASANHLGQSTKAKPARRDLLKMRLLDEAIDYVSISVRGTIYKAIMSDVRRIIGAKA